MTEGYRLRKVLFADRYNKVKNWCSRLRKVQEGYSKDISEFKVAEERICQSQDSDLKVIESEEGKGKSEIYLPNYMSRYSVTSEINSVSTFD